MLHAPERKRRRQHVLELLKGILHAEVAFERREGRADLRLERIDFDFLEARGTNPQRCLAWTARRPFPRARGERKQVGRKRVSFAEVKGRRRLGRRVHAFGDSVRECLPTTRHGQIERETRFEIGLIEAREECVRVRRHEQRVEIVVVVLVVVEADDARAGRRDHRAEVRRHDVFTDTDRRRGDAQVCAVERGRGRGVVHADVRQARSAEVENHVRRTARGEAHGDRTAGGVARDHGELLAVADPGQLARTDRRELLRDAGTHQRIGGSARADRDCGERQETQGWVHSGRYALDSAHATDCRIAPCRRPPAASRH